MKNNLAKATILAILGLIIWVVLVNVAKPKIQTNTQVAPVTVEQLQMEDREVVATGVSQDEQKRIVSFVDIFERAISQRDSEKVLSFFSAPETDEEQEDLDFILWKDVDPAGKDGGSRLFRTAGYNFSTSAHYIRNVSAQGANVRVIVDELRVIPSGGEWVGYSAKVSRLVVELRATSHGYQIAQYYHEDLVRDGVKKYEGFIAE